MRKTFTIIKEVGEKKKKKKRTAVIKKREGDRKENSSVLERYDCLKRKEN